MWSTPLNTTARTSLFNSTHIALLLSVPANVHCRDCRKKGGNDADKDKLKVIGAGVAVVAALAFGGVKVYQVVQMPLI